jgi:tetratricopeptide (TPR) repeat protein
MSLQPLFRFLLGFTVIYLTSERVCAQTNNLVSPYMVSEKPVIFTLPPACSAAHQHRHIAQQALDRGSYAEAEAAFSAILSACDVPGVPQAVIADRLSDLGASLYLQAKYSQAEAAFRRAWKLLQELAKPGDPSVLVITTDLAAVYQAESKLREAEKLNAEALAMVDHEHFRDSMVIVKLLSNFASVEDDLGEYEDAEKLIQRALALAHSAGGSKSPTLESTLPGVLATLAHIQQQRGNYAASQKSWLRCLSIQEELLGANHPQVAITLNNLAALYIAQYRYGEAEPLLNRSLDITAKTVGSSSPAYAHILANLALVAQKRQRLEDAERQFEQALAILERTLGPDDRRVGGLLNNLGELYVETKRYRDAKRLLERAVLIYERSGAAATPDFSGLLQNLALVRQASHHYSEAAELLRQAIAIDEKALGSKSPRVAADLDQEAINFFHMHRHDLAEADLLRAISICQHQSEAIGPLADSLENLAQLYWVEKRYSESAPLLQRAIPLLERLWGRDHPRLLSTFELYAIVMRKLGNYAEAEQAQVRATRIRVKKAIRES